MDVVTCESEMVTTSRDSAVSMSSTNDPHVDTPKHSILEDRKEADVQANKSVAEEDESEESGDIIYEIRYTSVLGGEHLHSRPLKRRAHDFEQPALNKSPVMKVVDVRNTWLEANAQEFLVNSTPASKDVTGDVNRTKDKPEDEENARLPPYESRLGSYIEITSPAVLEALQCVVDYAPEYDLGMRKLKIEWPYALLVHYDEALAKYQESFKSPDCTGTDCPGQFAYRHIGIVRDFVKSSIGTAVEDERKRHQKGMATYDMLWLLFPPGIDVLHDEDLLGEYQPHVMGSMNCLVVNGSVRNYNLKIWDMSATSLYIGPAEYSVSIKPFAGEVKINSLEIFPFENRVKNHVWGEKEEARQFFEQRGKTFFELRRQGCWDFRGYTTTFPRRPIEGLVISDPDRHLTSVVSGSSTFAYTSLVPNFETDNTLLFDRHCCGTCQKIMISQTKPFKFSGYSNINPLNISGLTDHQYFLCHRSAYAYVLKQRQWCELEVTGFRPAVYDKSILDTLVLHDPSVKQLIRSLTHKYLVGLEAEAVREAKFGEKNSAMDQQMPKKPWSPDFVKGKGEGLIFLLHGKPGVGKTYTAECIAANAGRPLLTITCADIGTDPVNIEEKLMEFFKYAKAWNAILLIDEADIFMEHRRVQDIERNSLVAAFLRAMEYYQGILFLTTNRVGMFDEAFISRINLTIYYPPFSDKARTEVWESFFQKLEREREGEIRVHNNTRAYVEESKELKQLQWNGREIRNAFQIAVSLAETEEERDSRGCIVIQQKHIEATVNMSRSFKNYLKGLYRKDEDAIAALRGNRNDSGPNGAASNQDEYY